MHQLSTCCKITAMTSPEQPKQGTLLAASRWHALKSRSLLHFKLKIWIQSG